MGARLKIAHLTTVDSSLWGLLRPQLTEVIRLGGTAIGIAAKTNRGADLAAAGVLPVDLRHSTRRTSPIADLRVSAELWQILRRIRPDVLHTHNPKPGVYGRIIGRLAGVPVVINTTHGLYASPEDRLAKRVVVYALEAIASRFSDYELVQSIEDYDLLVRWRLTRPGRTLLLGNGIDLSRFSPNRFGEPERAAARAELGIDSTAFVVGIVGRLVRGKGFVELIEAAERLSEHCVIVAIGADDADKSDALDNDMKARGVAAGVVFLGRREDVDRLYAMMDVFVLPSHREGFPRAAMEAAAMGLPIVASNIRGCRQAVEDGVTGILVPLRDADSIAESIRYLEENPPVRKRMGLAARRKALEEFDERSIVHTVLSTQIGTLREKGRFFRVGDCSPEQFAVRQADLTDVPVLAAICESNQSRSWMRCPSTSRSQARRKAQIAAQIQGIAVVEDVYGPVGFSIVEEADRDRNQRFRRLALAGTVCSILWRPPPGSRLSASRWANRPPTAGPGYVAVASPYHGIGLEARLKPSLLRERRRTADST